jgi:hypothetical protein
MIEKDSLLPYFNNNWSFFIQVRQQIVIVYNSGLLLIVG